MGSATMQISVVPKRLLKLSEAASYCGRSPNRFKAEAPFPPVPMPNGDKRYDVQDCDRWINTLKAGERGVAKRLDEELEKRKTNRIVKPDA